MSATPQSIQTPDTVETRLGTLSFRDGVPSDETVEKVYDQLDFSRGVEAFLNSFQGASLAAIRKGFRENGVQDNDFFLFSELMDSQSLFLTGNADTVYLWGFVDLSDGPIVVDIPALSLPSALLGTIDDMWFGWITDFGAPGPDRATGGKYLIAGPGYDGPLPDSGFHVSHSRTNVVTVVGRAFMIDNDPSGPVAEIKESFRVYPYTPGAEGTAVASYLAGEEPLAAPAEAPETKFVEGSGNAFNTIAPNDYSYWELINEVVQEQPAGSGDPEILGQLAAVGIVKGKPFSPDERMRGILEDAVAVGNATARTQLFSPREGEGEGFAYYEGSDWRNPLFTGGYEFLDPPPQITPDGVVPAESDGARKLNSRIAFFYLATVITPAMCMHLTGIGSQYLLATRDADGETLEGAKTYKLNLPSDIPFERFWSVMLYDNQTRSMLQTGQPKPDLGSQSGTVAENDDGSIDIYFGPECPDGAENNWLQTVPDKGFLPILRFYSPKASFFDKSWQPSEIKVVS
ncbi:MAG: DUF1254 domain-containing protein [Actinomycetota bacterium]|nr:DUF1254 domain-containing protein [Actinomycetota bacterium]